MKRQIFLFVVATAISIFAGDLKLNSLFSDDMVLQRGQVLSVYGEAKPGSEVSIRFIGKDFSTKSEESGDWKVQIGEYSAGGPYEMQISSNEKTITLTNLMIGDVWICSGQSNMNMPLAGWGRVLNYENEIANADYPNIRLLTIPLTLAPSPQQKVDTDGWKVCSPKNVENFSAVGYFFGRDVYKETNVPIGLIHVSKGGTPVETWMCEAALSDRPDLSEKIEWVKKSDNALYKNLKSDYKNAYKEWLARLDENDPGYTENVKWYSEEIDISEWETMPLPGAWEGSIGDYDGVIWFAKEVDIPESWSDEEIIVNLGPIQDYDRTYVNGEYVGDQTSRNSLSRYIVKPGLFRAGKNRIVTRVLDMYGAGGLWGKYDNFEVRSASGKTISLKGDWFYKKGVDLTVYTEKPPKAPNPDRNPMILFNGMVSPILDVRAAGVIWYQGESNSRNAYQYREMFPRMITHWRDHFNNDKMVFYFVQLANYTLNGYNVDTEVWATLRESQAAALLLPNTEMATAIDIGDPFDVHPRNKQEVGKRLALKALHNYYEKDIPFSGPVYKSVSFKGNKAIVSFDYTYNGFSVNDNKPIREFELAGDDEKFYPASAEISGDKIIVISPDVPNPAAVRYAWKNYPLVNLYNSAGLPIYPFRTDNYKLPEQE